MGDIRGESSFWRGHVQLGVASTSVCSLVGLVYALLVPGTYQVLVVGVGIVTLLSCPLILTRPVMRVLTGPEREPWLYLWSMSLLLAVVAASSLDGGGQSPLTALFAASLVFTATGFGRRGALVMGTSAVVGYLATCLVGAPPIWHLVLTVCALVVTAATCVLTADRLRGALAEQDSLMEQLRWQATHDGLTGCLNHHAFLDRLDAEVLAAQLTGQPLGLVTLDLDDFKALNDTRGHLAGDELLRELGAALRDVVRRHDVVGRVGGDEFAIVVVDADEVETLVMADRVRAQCRAVGAASGVGVSIGLSLLAEAGDGQELRRRADLALYDEKSTRRLPAS